MPHGVHLNIPIIMNNEVIPPTQELRYLGITIDQKLTFQNHFQRSVSKGNKQYDKPYKDGEERVGPRVRESANNL